MKKEFHIFSLQKIRIRYGPLNSFQTQNFTLEMRKFAKLNQFKIMLRVSEFHFVRKSSPAEKFEDRCHFSKSRTKYSGTR